MIDEKRRELFADLYRLAEYYEAPVFRAGDIDGNAEWFSMANDEALMPFLQKHPDDFALDLAVAVVNECSNRAAEKNKEAPEHGAR